MKKMKYILTAAAAAAIILTGCSLRSPFTDDSSVPAATVTPTKEPTAVPKETPTPTPTPTEEPIAPQVITPAPTEQIPDGMVKSYLTGEYVTPEIGRRRPVAFMIDNSQAGVPQSGISQAGIFYEAPVEANYSRICAVLENYDNITRIGPLRSCRDYFISLVSGLDCIYEHYGRAAYALPYLESDDVDNISGLLSSTYDCFFRDYTYHSGYHTAYINTSGILKAISIRGYSLEYKDGFTPMYKFQWVGNEDTHSDGAEASYVATGYPYNKPYFVYDSGTGLYTRYNYGTEQIDVENGEAITVKNIILEYENYDAYQHTEYLHFDTTSGGKGKYITDGKAIDITWSRPSFYEPAKYYDASGNEITLNVGKTWVCLIQNENIRQCVMGASADTAGCVVSDEEAAAAEADNAAWKAAYEYGEDEYLSGMAQQLKDELAEHGGQTKVGEGDG
ncbi:MAG TPA: DUF3048 domain-containing protein [Lachnospiraceae bacterium]|nr:DUF3048 domain-containing protein [Lachnospiraceae bacterium]